MAQVKNIVTGMTLDIPDDAVSAMTSQWQRVETNEKMTGASATSTVPTAQTVNPYDDLSRIGAASQPKVQELPGIGVITTVPKAIVPQARPAEPDTTEGLMARTGLPSVPAATPPAGATYISNPEELSGLTESQIWRQPGTNRIYRLPQQAQQTSAAVPSVSAVPAVSAAPSVPQVQATRESVLGAYRLNFFRDPTQAEMDWWSSRPQSELDAFMKSEVEKWKPTAPKPMPVYPSPDYTGISGTQSQQLQQAYSFYDSQLKALEAMIQQGYVPTAEEKALAAEFQAKREELRNFDLATLQRTEAMVGEGRGRTLANIQLAQDKERRIRALERLGLAQEAETLSERLSGAKEERQGLLGMVSALFDVSTKRFDAALGLTKELAAIDKQSRDDARTWLLDMVDWAQGLSWEELDADSQARITETVSNTPLTLNMVKQALKVGKEKLYATADDESATLLTPSEAAALGVPYGTTRGQAARLGIMPAGNLTTSQLSMLENVTTRYQADNVINTARNMGINMQIADAVIRNPSAGPEQIAALYTYIKTLDPTSAVREGEIGLATETQSFVNRWTTAIEKLAQGKVLDAATVTGLAEASKSIAQMWIAAGNRRTQQYIAQATALGVDEPFKRYLDAMSSEEMGGSAGGLSGLTAEEREYVESHLKEAPVFTVDMTPQQAITAAAKFVASGVGGATGTLIDVTRALGIPDEVYVRKAEELKKDPQKVWEWVKSNFPKSDASAGGTKSGGSASWRNNNPLNIKYGKFAAVYGATQGSAAADGGNFAYFPDEATGLKAARDLLRSDSYASLPLEQAMRRWSGNGYGAEVAPAELRNKTIGSMTDAELNRLIEAMRTREGWFVGHYLV